MYLCNFPTVFQAGKFFPFPSDSFNIIKEFESYILADFEGIINTYTFQY